MSDDAIEWLKGQDWPGNVRELENAIERAAVLHNQPVLDTDSLRSVPPLRQERGPGGGDETEKGSGGVTLKDAAESAEREAIAAALKATDGNRREAAKRLVVSLRTLFYKIERYHLE